MTQFALISQPIEFRTHPDIAEWVYVPSLHVLFGIGLGLRETLSLNALLCVRNMFLLGSNLDAFSPAPETLYMASRDHYQHNTPIREHAPPFIVNATDGTTLFRLTEDKMGDLSLSPAAKMKPRALSANPHYVVGATKRDDGAPQFTLYRRTGTLKPQYQAKVGEPGFLTWMRGFRRTHTNARLADLRLLYKSHLDYHAALLERSKPAALHAARKVAEQAAAAQMMHQKPQQPKPSKGAKSTKLIAPTNPLPESIQATISAIARPLIARRARRGSKMPSDLTLLEHALRKFAMREVEYMLHDFSLRQIATFTTKGLEFGDAEPLENPISITP